MARPPPSPPPPPPADPGPDAATLRGQAITGLTALIYAPLLAGAHLLRPDHDPALRQRTEAVELLGYFPDDQAAAALGALLLRGKRTLPPPAGRWLRDTALLTLLRSSQLPRPAVDRALRQAYSFLRHPLPWQWSAVYDDLPLLARYRKLGSFFWAFWLWPLLLFAVPTYFLIDSFLHPWTADNLPPLTVSLLIVVGSGLEIYLVHQVLIALLSGVGGPPLRIAGGITPRRKAWLSFGLTVLTIGVVVLIAWGIRSGVFSDPASGGLLVLRLIVVIVPLLLLPMFLLAHDLEQTVRYAPAGADRRLRVWAVVARRTIDLLYLLLLPLLAASVWSKSGQVLPLASLGFLAYLFAVPILVTGGLRVLSRVLAREASTVAVPPPGA